MSWNSVGRSQKCNKPYVQRAYVPKNSQKPAKQGVSEFEGDINDRVIQIAMRVVIMGQLPIMRR